MFAAIALIIGVIAAVSSFWMIRFVTHRPANGERATLSRMGKIEKELISML